MERKNSPSGFTWRIVAVLLACAAGLIQGCAGEGAIRDANPDGSLMLGLVTNVLTRDQIMNGFEHKAEGVKVPPTHKQLLSRGYDDRDVVDGSVVFVTYVVYRHSARGAVRGIWALALVPKGLTVAVNNIVEGELRDGVTTIVRVRYKHRSEGRCEIREGERGAMSILDAINPIGGPQTNNLYCPELESEGWVKAPSGIAGGYIWRKYPKPPLSR